MLEKDLLDEMAKAKAEIQSFQLWVDNAKTNRIAKVRYNKVKEKLRELVTEHKNLMRKFLLYIEGRTYGNKPIVIEAGDRKEAWDITLNDYVDVEQERFHLEETKRR